MTTTFFECRGTLGRLIDRRRLPTRPEAASLPNEETTVELYEGLRDGDEEATRKLWERCFPRLVALARARLSEHPRLPLDEEDVALSVFDSLCIRARRGEFPNLDDRDGLWRLLVTVTARKVKRYARDERRRKRGAGRVVLESTLDEPGRARASGERAFDRFPKAGPSPGLEAELSEEFVRLLERLESDDLRRIALWRMDGHTNVEIATMLGCARPTVERRLSLIRKIWTRDAGQAT